MKAIPLALSGIALALAPPMAHCESHWFKGNTHTHTLWSDGNDFPESVAGFYRDRGYHFLVLSDHNVLSRAPDRWMSEEAIRRRQKALSRTAIQKAAERFGDDWLEARDNDGIREYRLKTLDEIRPLFEKPGEFIFVEGEEITVSGSLEGGQKLIVHLNALNLTEVLPPIKAMTVRETIRANLKAAAEQAEATGEPILAHLNHPNFQWGVSAEDLAHVIEEEFFEVYNGHPGINHLGDASRPSDERIWDIANTIRIDQLAAAPLFGIASDDSHDYHGGDVSPGRGWVQVRAPELEARALVSAMRAGDFYASTGVTLDAVSFDRDTGALHLQIRPEDGVTFTTTITGTREGFDRTTTEIAPPEGDPYEKRLAYSEDVGATIATVEGESVTYTLAGDELYVRATVNSSKPHPNPSFKDQHEKAWTQPVGWKKRIGQ
ncbi:hypothetical protein BH23VER1_BH23VER1_25810 [soil metagenome]